MKIICGLCSIKHSATYITKLDFWLSSIVYVTIVVVVMSVALDHIDYAIRWQTNYLLTLGVDGSEYISDTQLVVYCEVNCKNVGFPCEMDFFHHKSPNPTRVASDEGGIRRRVLRKSISHGKPHKIHLTWKLENHTKYIYSLTLHFKAR